MNETILTTLIETGHPIFTRIAEAWEAIGIPGFEIIAVNGTDTQTATSASEQGATEAIHLNGELVGWLKVPACCNAPSFARLQADAEIISSLLQQEYEIEEMTSELIDQQDRLLVLHHLAQTTRIQSNYQQTLESLAAVAARFLKAEGAFMQLRVEGQEPYFAAYPPERWPETLWPPLLQNFDTYSSKKQWLLQQHNPIIKQLELPLRNFLIKQVRVRSGVSFVLGVVNKITGDFQTPDIKLLSTITEPAGASLENELLQRDLLDQTRIQTEMELAKQVQMRLLPRSAPRLTGIDLAVQSQPAFQVGGDFYDFVANDAGLLNFVVADVSGKGMPAALLMTMLRTVLRGEMQQVSATTPDQILDRANLHLYDDFSEVDMFATVFLGQYDAQCHQLRYANQGHSPVIYRPVDGTAMLLKADAPPLGVLPTSLAQLQTIDFRPGDLLVVASDGFSEAERSNGEMFGYERLLQRIDQSAYLPAAELLATMFFAVCEFAGGYSQSDDQTMLVLKRDPLVAKDRFQ